MLIIQVLTRLVENYPEIGTIAKLLFVSKDVKKLVLSEVKYLIVPSYTQEGKRCVLKPGFLRKFLNLKSVCSIDTVNDRGESTWDLSTIGCHVIFDDAPLPKIKGLNNVHAEIHDFAWYCDRKDSSGKLTSQSLISQDREEDSSEKLTSQSLISQGHEEDSSEKSISQGHEEDSSEKLTCQGHEEDSSEKLTCQEWEKNERHLRNILILEIFVDLCNNSPEGTEYVGMSNRGIFSDRNSYINTVAYGAKDPVLIYSLQDKTLHTITFVPHDLETDVENGHYGGNRDEDGNEGDSDEVIMKQIYAEYKAYFLILSGIEIKNINDLCFKFIIEACDEDPSMANLFKDLEGVVCGDPYNEDDAVNMDNLIAPLKSRYDDDDNKIARHKEITKKFLEPIKHYYLLSSNRGFVSYINEYVTIYAIELAGVISDINDNEPLTDVLTFPNVHAGDLEYVRRIFPNADVKKDED